ncbi:MAG TPA: lipase, partial [Clostridiales bacterium]|nr:lipase [Clostridiales bacterium]
MEFKTNYPIVMVHGMLGYGKDELMDVLIPYWGMLTGSLPMYLEDQGFSEVYAPSVGKYSSAWDRACELYAQLMGGTVDYGVAHAKKYGHKRFGRTYDKPLFEGFGPDKKV